MVAIKARESMLWPTARASGIKSKNATPSTAPALNPSTRCSRSRMAIAKHPPNRVATQVPSAMGMTAKDVAEAIIGERSGAPWAVDWRILEFQQSPGIHHHGQRSCIVEHGRDESAARAKDAAGGEGDDHDGPTQPHADIDEDGAATTAAQAHASRQPAQIIAHQHEVRRSQGDIRAVSAHRHANGAGFEREGVIDAVTHDHRAMAVANLTQDELHLFSRKSLRVDVLEIDLACDLARLALGVSRDHQLSSQTQLLELLHGLFGFWSDLVRQ